MGKEVLTALIFIQTTFLPSVCFAATDGYVSYYQIFRQSSTIQRIRRDNANTEHTYYHPITIFNKSLVLVLGRDNTVFDDGHVLDTDTEKTYLNLDYLVTGYVMNFENASHVVGSFINGRFQGEIAFNGGESYFVEDARKFLPTEGESSIVYRSSDVKQEEIAKSCLAQTSSVSHYHRVARAALKSPTSGYSQSTATTSSPPKVCGLYIQVDYLLYKEHLKDAHFNHDEAVKTIMAMVHYVVKTANYIFSDTDFTTSNERKTGSSTGRKLQISIIRTKIYKTADEFAAKIGASSSQLNQSLDAVSFLNMISGVNYELFCASYVFTYRYFDGVLGLAWVFAISQPNFISAGACAKYVRTNSNLRPYMRSQNSGIVTFVNYGQRISLPVAAVTFAHELGHTFGAEHDNKEGNDPACSPDGQQGNFIMFASATSGDRPNNMRFSDCSRHSIATSLSLIVNNPSAAGCLKDVAHFCGNSVVDPGEECDCGFKEDCGLDANCCGPADDVTPSGRCRLRISPSTGVKVSCSSSNGACCNSSTCSFIPQSSNHFCRNSEECRRAAFCDGKSASCPTGLPEPDGKICSSMVKICKAGECAGSICEIIQGSSGNYTSCQAEKPAGNVRRYNRSELCYLACRSTFDGQCFNSAHVDSESFDIDFRSFLLNTSNGKPIQLKAGSPCDNDRGYCDILKNCRPINADEAPLARLATLLFSTKTAVTIKAWVEQRWWAVAFIGVGVLTFMVGFLKFCAVHTKSDNRMLPPARSFSDTLRRVRSIGTGRTERSESNSVSRSSNNRTGNPGQALSELRQFLANNTVAEDDEQRPNLCRVQHLQLPPESDSPLLQDGARRNPSGKKRGHVRSAQTRIVHSEYHGSTRPSYRLPSVSSHRVQTITESPND